MNRLYTIWLCIICASLPLRAYAQDPLTGAESPVSQIDTSKSERILADIEQRFDQLNDLIFPKSLGAWTDSPYGTSLLNIDTITARESLLNQAIGNRVNAEIAEFKSNWGLSLTGQTYYRLDGVMNIDEDEPQSRYTGKIQVEARWYFMQSSLFQRKGNINAIRIQGDIDRALQERDRLDLSVYQQKEYFRQVSDSLLSGILQHHITNLSLLTDAYLYLLENGGISSDELLKVLSEKAEAERQLVTLAPGVAPATDLAGIDVYTVDVDTTAMIRHIERTAVDLRLLDLRLKLLEQQEKNTSYWSKCNVAPFLRYSFYFREYAANSGNVDAGVSFTIPINTVAAHQRKTIAAQRAVLEAEGVDVLRQVTDKVRYYAIEIERLNRASIGEVRRIDEIKGYLTVRGHAYQNRKGEYNRLSRLKEYNNYLVCLEKLIAIQYQRDCYVADLQRLLTTGSILDFCTEKRIAPLPPEQRTLSVPNNEK